MGKSFTSGLESIFSGKVTKITKLEKHVPEKTKEIVPTAKKDTSKEDNAFFTNLDKIFQESFDSVGLDDLIVNTQVGNTKKNPSKKQNLSKGFDDLFEPTVDDYLMNVNNSGVQKRITFTFDADKVEILKQIAQEERAFLKDIISKIVDEYLKKYRTAD